MGRLREVLLWAGAALGLLAITAGIAVAFGGFSFLVFRSGSMSPEIPTGGLALSRTIDAADLRPGDVVSVTAATGDRITHRIVEVTLRGDEASLVLKGDANATADSEVYVVTSAERVVASVPLGGYVLAHALTPPGLLAMACLSMMLFLAGGRRSDEDDNHDDHDGLGGVGAAPADSGGKHRAARRVSMIALVAAAVAGGTSGTMAVFTDVGTASTSVQSAAIAAPVTPSVAQGSGGGGATVTWTSTAVGTDGLAADSYDVLRYPTATGGTATVVCSVSSTRSCTDSAPGILVTYYYAIRARLGPNWSAEGARRSYSPTVVSPTLSIVQPTSGSRAANTQRDLLTCANAAPACGTMSAGSTVTYTFVRNAKAGAQCWSGAAWAATCPANQQAIVPLGGTTWTIPGTEDAAFPSGDNDRGTYTLTVTATNAVGSSSQTVQVTIT